jgi:hypothetical protein
VAVSGHRLSTMCDHCIGYHFTVWSAVTVSEGYLDESAVVIRGSLNIHV